jgi:hypothetical protein
MAMTVYYLSHKYKYIWYVVPKCGRTSLFHWLIEHNLIEQEKTGPPTEVSLSVKHNRYFTFAFCRNPYDRLVSVYFDKVKKQQLPLYRIWKDKSFQEFASDVCDMPTRKMDGHLIPQVFRIPENINFLGRFENLQNDFYIVTNQLFSITFDNRKYNSTKHKHYSEYYNKALKDKVYTKYKEDFEIFGYDPE